MGLYSLNAPKFVQICLDVSNILNFSSGIILFHKHATGSIQIYRVFRSDRVIGVFLTCHCSFFYVEGDIMLGVSNHLSSPFENIECRHLSSFLLGQNVANVIFALERRSELKHLESFIA